MTPKTAPALALGNEIKVKSQSIIGIPLSVLEFMSTTRLPRLPQKITIKTNATDCFAEY